MEFQQRLEKCDEREYTTSMRLATGTRVFLCGYRIKGISNWQKRSLSTCQRFFEFFSGCEFRKNGFQYKIILY